jgi:hypothetical protein
MLECTIVGISQEMDFEQNATVTYLLVRLANGKVLRAAIDEEDAASVVELQVKEAGAPRAVPRAPRPQARERPPPPPPEMDEDEVDENGNAVHIFGGPDTGEAPAVEEEEEPPPPPSPVAARPVQRLPNGKPYMPAKTVPKDDAGYPIVRGSGVDPDELTSGRNVDEDGVGSV